MEDEPSLSSIVEDLKVVIQLLSSASPKELEKFYLVSALAHTIKAYQQALILWDEDNAEERDDGDWLKPQLAK